MMNRQANQSWRTRPRLSLALVLWVLVASHAQEAQVSELGQYQGYTEPIYDQWVRTSQYVTVWDGTRLAVDILRPARGGVPVEEPLPVIWTHDRYQRAITVQPSGRTITQVWGDPWLETLLRHGYVVGVVDVRGAGASYGTRTAELSPEESLDAYAITEWFAAQPWCTGRIGMYGRSYLGMTQFLAAGTHPPHLVALFPEMVGFDMYSFIYPGGVYHHDIADTWGEGVKRQDTAPTYANAPVDEDLYGTMLAEAMSEHWANVDVAAWLAGTPYRDSLDENGVMTWSESSPSTSVEAVKQSGVAIYHLAGWYDGYPRAALEWFNNLEPTIPQKIVIGPWSHGWSGRLDPAAEHLRWYDFWLKGVDNGVMDEPPIHYFTMGAPAGQQWRSAWQWPLPNEQRTSYYFQRGPSDSANSVNDGLLGIEAPADTSGQDDVTVDYTTTTGTATRWTNTYGGDFDYPDMTTNDEKGLTYTTPPLQEDVELTGHPVVHLWVTSTAADGDFFVYLEEVEETAGGRNRGGVQKHESHYITEGTLRASHRALSEPPYDNMGLPYHRSFAEDLADLPAGEPVELIFDLLPTSNIFDKGHRIRVTVTCADRDNTQTPELSPAPTVSVYRNADYASYIVLPIIPVDPQGP